MVNYGLLERRKEGLHIGHALIHEYAAGQLALGKEELKRVAAFYIDWCREQSAAGVSGYARMDGERVHCLRLIGACLEKELWEEVKGLVGAIHVYLDRQGWWTAELTALEMRLTATRKISDRRDEVLCLNRLGITCWRRGDFKQALKWYEHCLPLWRELGDLQGKGMTLNNIAGIYQQQEKYEKALEYYKQSLSIAQEFGNRKGEGSILNNIGMLCWVQKKNEQALSYYEQCQSIWQEIGDKVGESGVLNNIGSIYNAQRKLGKALEQHKQALTISRELGDRAGEAQSCWNLGRTHEDMGDLILAEEYIALSVKIAEAIEYPELEKYRNVLERVRAILDSRWRFWLYKGGKILLNWVRAARRGA